jgi:phosphoribosylanthranilate isomerase
MARAKVKICGITNLKDARQVIKEGADFLGFNFYEGSSRYISPAKARKIAEALRERVTVVGVFVNEDERKMLEIAHSVGLDYLQLHGDETHAMVARLKRSQPALKIIKAIRVQKSFRAGQLAGYKRADALLLDGFDSRLRGGTGKTFDWSVAERAKRYGRIFLAGGIRPENAAVAIRAAQPYAIDVCSGVESAPGKKDHAKVRELMRAVTKKPVTQRKRRKS